MAERTEIITELEALETHCRAPLMAVEARTSWMRDWCDDLGEFPLQAIRNGCKAWRQSGNTKFPTPGQLLPMVRANTVKRTGDAAAQESWRDLDQEEYRALSLSEKIRHQSILQSHALSRAGPMWRNGAPLTAEDMPETWHTWRARAANHGAEVRRLTELRKEAKARGEDAA